VNKAIDALCIVLVVASGGAFTFGVRAVSNGDDLLALYWLVVGALLLRAAVEMLRPRSGAK
jgi:hypothetical protein